MYAYVCGKVRSLNPTAVLVDNQGLGFLIQISLHTYTAIKEAREVQLYTHCVLKNESQAASVFAIYGFATPEEKSLFMQLISVSGVGNSTAQLILSSFDPGELTRVIGMGDAATLQRVKGIGAKTAQRIVIDLKDKLGKMTGGTPVAESKGNTIREESLGALLTLGFGRPAAEKAVTAALSRMGSEGTVEAVIKAALSHLSG